MAQGVSFELTRRSVFFSAGSIECLAEWRTVEWPRCWAYQAEPHSREFWFSRLYVCMARVQRRAATLAPALPQPGAEAPVLECKILDFKAPIRTA